MLHVRTSQLIIAGMCAVFKEISPCRAMENIRCDVEENLWPDRMSTKKHLFHGCYFVFLCICANIRNMKYTVIGQVIFHFTCNTFIQKEMYCINTNVHILFFLCTIDSSHQMSYLFYKTLISKVDCHGEKQLNMSTSVAHTM